MNAKKPEHFVTLFDSNFLPQGIALHASLLRLAGNFRLWVLCMDEKVEERLRRLDLPHLTCIPLKAIETTELLAIKPTRSHGEYCWTLTPFTFDAVWKFCPEAPRVTYIDADLFFFDRPEVLFKEFEQSGKGVQITDHAYAPEYDQSELRGKFCVQFLTCVRRPRAREVIRWWQERCLEWCYSHVEEGRFGDQKYLDVWPEMFGDEVHILSQVEKTLGPWNVDFFMNKGAVNLRERPPVIYHYHGLRILTARRLLLFKGYKIRGAALEFYSQYVEAVGHAVDMLRRNDMDVPLLPPAKEAFAAPREILRRLRHRVKYAELPSS